jgi:hypothetical protein
MNCERFEEIIIDLVKEGGLEDAVRLEAMAHADSCGLCLARLQGQQALNAIFKLAAADSVEAPANVETSLLSAYRLHREKATAAASPHRARSPRWRFLGIAAALLVMLLGVVIFRSLQTPGSARIAARAPGAASPENSPAAAGVRTAVRAVPKDEPEPLAMRLEPATISPAPRQSVSKTQPADGEVATDFFPLASRTEIASMESGQIVRVLLPRNAMANYGLPVSQEHMDEPVAAQVLIGQDGVARAIRFLSTQNAGYVPVGMRAKH